MICVILCGGLGTRISKYFSNVPKILIKVNKKPFIDYKIRQLKKFKKIYLCCGFKSDQISTYVQEKKIKKIIIEKEKQLLGTGGSLKNIIKKIPTRKFFFTYGDNYLLDLPFSKMVKLSNLNKKSVLLIYKNNNKFDKSNVSIVNKTIIYKKNPKFKANYIDYGFFYLDKKHVLKCMPDKKKFDFAIVLKKLISKKLINYIEVNRRFYEIGTKKGYDDFKKYSKRENI